MPLDANSAGQAQGGIPRWMMGLHNAVDPVQALGGYGNVAAMALPVGRAVPMNFKVSNYAPGTQMISHKLPSGVTAEYYAQRGPSGGLGVHMEFGKTGRARMGLGERAPTPEIGVDRLKDVYASIEALVSRVKPSSLTFEAATDRLRSVYNKVAPQMAEKLGGKLTSAERGSYEISFPNAQTYPLPK